MTFGAGWGPQWGGNDPLDPAKPVSTIAGTPTSFNFSDEQDGPLPGLWGFFALDVDGGGLVSAETETSVNAYYRIINSLALWDYTRSPTVGGPPYAERGVLASPSGILASHNARSFILVKAPTELLDTTQDELFWEVTLALRFDPTNYSYIAARARARWEAGVWTTPLALEAISVVGTNAPTVLAELVGVDDIAPPKPAEVWTTQEFAELSIEVRDTTMVVGLNGIYELSVQVPATARIGVGIELRVYNRKGALLTALPSLQALSVQSLRDLSRLGPPPQIDGGPRLDAPVFPILRVPVQDMMNQSPPLLRQISGRQFEALVSFVAEVPGFSRFRVDEGEVLRATEKYVGQTFVPMIRDLAAQRARKGL